MRAPWAALGPKLHPRSWTWRGEENSARTAHRTNAPACVDEQPGGRPKNKYTATGLTSLHENEVGRKHVPLPQLDRIAFRVDDEGPHEGGGVCAAMPSDDPVERRKEMVWQYVRALGILADSAGKETSWESSRPIIFVAHHACELALDLVADRVNVSRPREADRHSLVARFEAAAAAGAFKDREAEEAEWCRYLLTTLESLNSGFAGRYVDGRGAIEKSWCCLNPAALTDAVEVLASICTEIVSETNDGGKENQQ